MTERASKMCVSPPDVREFGKQLGELFNPQAKDPRDEALVTTGHLIRGRSELYSLRPGLRLITIDMDIQCNVEVNVETACSGMFVALALDGRCRSAVRNPGGRDKVWEFRPDRKFLGTFQPDRTAWTICGNGAHRFVELQMDADVSSKIISEFREAVPGRLHPALIQLGNPPEFIPQPLTPELMLVAHQVLDCPLEGSARRFFMEGKALEILALQLGAFSSMSLRETATPNRVERERLEEARKILNAEYSDPPTLLALARRVGLNDFKLKRGFKAIYQTTVFGYVRRLRMAKSLAMLQTGDMNVSEIASAMGYSCFGHFSRAFRKQFGITPSDVRKKRRTGK
jgi:AraC family transcriptional activator of pyochelin receptor